MLAARLAFACLLASAALPPAAAQNQTGLIVGMIAGPDGKAIPGAQVSVTPLSSGASTHPAVVQQGNRYRFNLAAGVYGLTAAAPTFGNQSLSIQLPTTGATAIANFRLPYANPAELQIVGGGDAASYRAVQSAAGFDTWFVDTGLPDGSLVFNDALDASVDGYTVTYRNPLGEAFPANIYFVTATQISVQRDQAHVVASAEGEGWTVQVCQANRCGPQFNTALYPHTPSFFALGSGDAIVTDQANRVNLPDARMNLFNAVLSSWMNGEVAPNDDVRFFAGLDELNALYYGETNGIPGFMQANLTANGSCAAAEPSSLCQPGRHLLLACNTSETLSKPLCSSPVHGWFGEGSDPYFDATGWADAVADLYSDGIRTAEVQIVEQSEYLLDPLGQVVRNRNLVIIDPNLYGFNGDNYYLRPPIGEWDVEIRPQGPLPTLNFTGEATWRVTGYGQDTATTAANPNLLFTYTQPSDGRELVGDGQIVLQGSLDGRTVSFTQPFTRERNYERERLLEARQALRDALLIDLGRGFKNCVDSLSETAEGPGGEQQFYFLRETANGGDLGFASLSIYMDAATLQDPDEVAKRLEMHELLRDAYLDLDAPHMYVFTCGVQNKDLDVTEAPPGSPVDFTRNVFMDRVQITIPRNVE